VEAPIGDFASLNKLHTYAIFLSPIFLPSLYVDDNIHKEHGV